MKKKNILIATMSLLAVGCIGIGTQSLNDVNASAANSATFKAADGASVKFMENENDSGIRFQYYLENVYFDSLLNEGKTAFAENVEVGAIVIPYDLLDSSYKAETPAFDGLYAAATAENSLYEVKAIPATKWVAETTKEGVETGWKTSYAYLYGLPSEYYTRDIFSVGYVKNGDSIVYTDEIVRNMDEVAYAELETTTDEEEIAILEKYLVNHEYTVTVTDGVSEVASLKVKNGATVSESAIAMKEGYDYVVYDFDFATKITKDTTIVAEYWKGVATPAEFMAMNATDNYVLERDINFLGVDYTPVAKIGGVLDGNGFAVYNVAMNPESGSTGLLLEVTGTVKNFGMESPYLAASTSATAQNGMLVQHLNGGTVEDSYVLNGVMDGTYVKEYSGQLVGKATNAVVKNVVVDVVLTNGTSSMISLLVGSGTWEAVNFCACIRDASDYSGCWCNPTVDGGLGWNYFSVYGNDAQSTSFKSKLNASVWGWDTTKVWQNDECSMDTTLSVSATYEVTVKEGATTVKTLTVNDGDAWTKEQLLKEGADYGFYTVNGRNVDLTAPIMANVVIDAEFWTGVATPAEFMAMSATGNYLLEQNIDFTGITYVPVAKIGGILDGNGYAVQNVTIEHGATSTGLILELTGTIRNLATENCALTAGSNAQAQSGLLVHNLNGGVIENVVVNGTIAGQYDRAYVGQVVGVCSTAGGTLRNVLIDVVCTYGVQEGLVSGVSFAVGRGSFWTGENVLLVLDDGDKGTCRGGAATAWANPASTAGVGCLHEAADALFTNNRYQYFDTSVWTLPTDNTQLATLKNGCTLALA